MVQLKKKFENVTFLDHKKVHAYGQNWTHQRQCVSKHSKRKLRPLVVAKNNTNIHGMFIANKYGCDVFLYGKIKFRPRKKVNACEDEVINEDEYIKGLSQCVVPFMKSNNSNILLSDCVNINHTEKIEKFLLDNGIDYMEVQAIIIMLTVDILFIHTIVLY